MSNQWYELRPAVPSDAEALQQACWPNRSVLGVRELLERVEGISSKGRGLGVVAYNQSGILGYGQLTVWPRVTEISDLIVTPTYRGQGIGSAIICYLLNQVRKWHVPKVEIGVALSNPRAHALYRRLGFKEDRIIMLDLGDGPEPVMYLSISLEGEYKAINEC